MDRSDPREVENSAGGYTFELDIWGRLDRWLILGAEGGSYYATERELTRSNAKTIQECLDDDGVRAVVRIVDISESGRAPKNDPAIFALALAAAHSLPEVRRAAMDALPRVCRIGTHLFQFVATVKEFRGWGRGLRRGIANWYLSRPADKLAYQVAKYQSRGGFSHRDVLMLSHCDASGTSPEHQAVLRWAVAGADGMGTRVVSRRNSIGEIALDKTYTAPSEHLPKIIEGLETIKPVRDAKEAAALISEYKLTHEMVPNEVKGDPRVWEALLETMPLGAMVRNLGKMTSIDLLKPMSDASKKVIAKIGDAEAIRKARLHPLAVLVALNTYRGGQGVRGNLTWNPVTNIVEALNEAFYLAFDAVKPTGKNILLALDVSGSMGWGEIAGMPGITPRVGSAAMAMVTARTEANYQMVGFTGGWLHGCGQHYGTSNPLTQIDIGKRDRLDTALQTVASLQVGPTDCALPMLWAAENKIEVDAFHIYTDSETWAGEIKPHQALREYRNKMGRDARLCVVGMVGNDFTIADPSDQGMLDVVGFDTSAPSVMADFTRGAF